MTGSIIVFSGMDGAGKSTQIETLRERLAANSRRPRTFWSRGGYTSGMNLLKLLLRRGSAGTAVPPSGPSEVRTQAFQKPLVRRCWLRLAILDLIVIYGVWLRTQRWLGRDVICDRYLDDTALDFRLNFPQEDVSKWWMWKLLQRLTPTPNVAFLLLISVAESQRRSKLKDEPFPDSADVLATRWEAYQQWRDCGRYIVLDGECSKAELAAAIWSAVDNCHTPPRSANDAAKGVGRPYSI